MCIMLSTYYYLWACIYGEFVAVNGWCMVSLLRLMASMVSLLRSYGGCVPCELQRILGECMVSGCRWHCRCMVALYYGGWVRIMW